MADELSDLPDTGTATTDALSYDEGVSKISELLQGPDESPTVKASQSKDDTDSEADDADSDELEVADANDDDDSNVEDDDDDEDQPADNDDDDESDDDEDAVFADETAMVKMHDGQTLSVADLKAHVDKRVNDFRRDHEAKSTELAQERGVVSQFAQELQTQRDYLMQMMQFNIPQPPSRELMDEDLHEYTAQKENYEYAVRQYQTLEQQSQQVAAQQQQLDAQNAETAKAERYREIYNVHSDFQDPEKLQKFDQDLETYFLPNYGWSKEQLAEGLDHRLVHAMKDLVKYQKMLKAAPKAKAKVAARPGLLRGGQRPSSTARSAKRTNTLRENLRKSGSKEDGIALIMDRLT